MKVVVTGGAGFIGSNLADELARDHEVTVIDNLSTGRIENLDHMIPSFTRRPSPRCRGRWTIPFASSSAIYGDEPTLPKIVLPERGTENKKTELNHKEHKAHKEPPKVASIS